MMIPSTRRSKVPSSQGKQEASCNADGGKGAAAGVLAEGSRPWPTGLSDHRIVRVARTLGGKDRHSKVSTIRGLRDRRVRLSVPTAVQLYDLQDRLGLNQPSKVVDWLLDAARHEIDRLPPLQIPPGCFLQCPPSMAAAVAHANGAAAVAAAATPPDQDEEEAEELHSGGRLPMSMECGSTRRRVSSAGMVEKDGFFRRIEQEHGGDHLHGVAQRQASFHGGGHAAGQQRRRARQLPHGGTQPPPWSSPSGRLLPGGTITGGGAPRLPDAAVVDVLRLCCCCRGCGGGGGVRSQASGQQLPDGGVAAALGGCAGLLPRLRTQLDIASQLFR